MGNADRKPILVLGGTGHFGQHIVASLLAKGVPVRVLSRNAQRARGTLGPGPEIIEGDITSRQSVVEALEGTAAVVISVSAFAPGTIRRLREIEQDAVLAVLAEAERIGVSRVVYVSIYDVSQGAPEGVDLASAEIKAQVEAALAGSSLNWTVLGAPPSMEIFFAMIRGGIMIVPGGGPPALPTVSPRDLGEIAAQAALRNDLSGKRFRVVGPEAMSFPQAAERIGKATGRRIRFFKVPLLLPRAARAVTHPMVSISDRVFFVNQMLGFVELLNRFPQSIAGEAAQAHALLLETFDYAPTTLEREARRRSEESVGRRPSPTEGL